MKGRTRPDSGLEKKKIFWWIGLAAASLLLLWLLFAPGRGYVHYRKMQREMKELAQETKRMEAKNLELVEEINRLKTDKSYLEEVARQKHGMLKKDEMVFEFTAPRKKGKE